MGWITRKVKNLVSKYRGRYGKRMGIILAVAVVAALPLPIPGIAFGIQGFGEVLRPVGVHRRATLPEGLLGPDAVPPSTGRYFRPTSH